MSARGFLLGLGLLLVVSIAWGSMESRLTRHGRIVRSDDISFLPSTAPARQMSDARIERPWRPKEVRSFRATTELRQPIHIVAGDSGSLFVLDGGDGAVRKLSAGGTVLVRFKDPRAPRPSHFTIDDHDNLWVSDPNGQVVRFDRSGKPIDAWSPSVRILRLAATRDALFTMNAPLSNRLFALRAPTSEVRKQFGTFIEHQRQRTVVLVGHLLANADGGRIFYVPQYGGFITAYDDAGDEIYSVRTVDSPPLPRMETTAGGAVRLPPDLPVTVRSLTIGDGVLYLLTRQTPNWGPQKTFIDAYASETGAYLYSVLVPEPFITIAAAADGRMYSGREASLIQWSALP